MCQECLIAPEHSRPPRLQPEWSTGGHASAESVFDPRLIVALLGEHVLREESEYLAAHDQATSHVGWVERLDNAVRVELNVESARTNNQILSNERPGQLLHHTRHACGYVILTFEYAV